MTYWEQRKNYKYYKKALELIKSYDNCNSIIDIGGRDTEILKNLSFRDKVCLDLNKLPESEGIRTIKCDFYKWVPDNKYDIVTCLQVLEHLDDPKLFVKKIFELSNRIVIISVPYMWPKGFCKYHVQDPVDENVIFNWVQKIPDESYIVEDASVKRIICVYYNY
jgi:hypothetical protein